MQHFTLDELADAISDGLPQDQRDANRQYLSTVFRLLKDGGVWGWTDARRFFIKQGDGFTEITEEQ